MRGRKPTEEKVVPLAEDGAQLHNLEERARVRLDEIRPEGLTGQLRWTFDRLALPLCHPTVDRLKPSNVFMFRQLCAAVVRHDRLTLELEELGETYESQTRNGKQIKARPEVAQLNETFRQIRALANDFGMTPAAERGLSSGGQMGFSFPDPNSPEGYLT
ncbi:P27 family phage terminase small subunit [Phaeobacter gallaeciensis]|uniref:P27 family phage terminase small subunit n=1 Tax=Phaeobacter gallaeciensis TaxID=60890 RepID=UPI00237F596C|nr:P27 family phage terminase small subunit [Phaeobacter gallaeciensis]MDE4098959.1 P27 family phage terminase small subunit [Phaeobacter gallaeciensis]MDE4107769.1 P27 family phage terminase small subunit [Phaeobacter gallaeciensis]MDE4112223.1 P27 family phage terminase small subunit [Phaeobacter gallaeciensis]MDE4116695.1 P27 family phage terminase small subunit [Phaeobacter gallaeciensis]MDE4121165.1 P27 family phage terminase small subunit [Phaeobacter gallaeciensis]